MRYQFPDTNFPVVQVAGCSEITPGPAEGIADGDGGLIRVYNFGGSPGYRIVVRLASDGIDVDAPGLVLDERASSFTNGIRILRFVPET